MLLLHQYSEAFTWADPQTIVGISLITMVFTGLSSTIAYLKLKRIDVKTGTLFLTGSIPGSIVGAWINSFIDADKFSLYFGILMLFILVMLFIDRDQLFQNKPLKLSKTTRVFILDQHVYRYNVPLLPAFILSFVVGILSGLFGIGGGTISVPALILFFGIPVQIAIATSMFMILFISIISTTTHII